MASTSWSWEEGVTPTRDLSFSPQSLPAAHPLLSQQTIRHAGTFPPSLQHTQLPHPSLSGDSPPWCCLAPCSEHGRSWEGPCSLENVSLAHRQQLTTLCSRRPGAPAVLISIIQAPCVSHSPSPLGFLLPVNKHVALRFLDGGLCREQCWPQTDHHQGLIFPSAGFYLQHDERLFLPLCILSNHIYCGELYFLLCFAGNTDIRGIFPAIQFPSI